MNSNEQFKTSDEHVLAVLAEISDTQRMLRELSSRMAQLDKYVRRAFPLAAQHAPKPQRPGKADAAMISDLTREEALSAFDAIKEVWAKGEMQEFGRRLETTRPEDLIFIAREIGLTFKKKPSRKAVADAITRRVKESALLSRNVNSPTRDTGQGDRR